MLFLHTTGEHLFDITHHSLIFGAGNSGANGGAGDTIRGQVVYEAA